MKWRRKTLVKCPACGWTGKRAIIGRRCPKCQKWRPRAVDDAREALEPKTAAVTKPAPPPAPAARQRIIDMLDDEEVLFFDPPEVFDAAIIGLGERINLGPVVVYDYDLIMAGLQRWFKDEEDPHTSAAEWYDHNTAGSWVGEKTPIIVRRPT